jgi:ferrous iron transport protein B
MPGVMSDAQSSRTARDRLATILVAPLMTCSARHAGLRAADRRVHSRPRRSAGLVNLQGLVLFGLYVAGIVSALAVAYAMKLIRRDSTEHALLLELPSYRVPHVTDVLIGLWERASVFLKRVGGIILTLTVLLWFLSTFPLRRPISPARRSTTAMPAASAARWKPCSRRSASTGRSASR